MFLSQPPIATSPSNPSAATEVSMEFSDHLTRDQAITHALCPHADAIGDRDGVEINRFSSCRSMPSRVFTAVRPDVRCRRHVARRRGNGDLRFAKIIGETDARSMDRAGARSLPSTTTEEWGRGIWTWIRSGEIRRSRPNGKVEQACCGGIQSYRTRGRRAKAGAVEPSIGSFAAIICSICCGEGSSVVADPAVKG